MHRRLLKILIMLVPVGMAGSVIVTGSHYLIDYVVGDLLAGSALAVARFVYRHRAPAPQHLRVHDRHTHENTLTHPAVDRLAA